MKLTTLCTLSLLIFPPIMAADASSPISIQVKLENRSFDIEQYKDHHINVLVGEDEEHMFIPGIGKSTTKSFTLTSGSFFKAVLGTKSDYPFVLGGFGSLGITTTNIPLSVSIILEATPETSAASPVKLGNSIFSLNTSDEEK